MQNNRTHTKKKHFHMSACNLDSHSFCIHSAKRLETKISTQICTYRKWQMLHELSKMQVHECQKTAHSKWILLHYFHHKCAISMRLCSIPITSSHKLHKKPNACINYFITSFAKPEPNGTNLDHNCSRQPPEKFSVILFLNSPLDQPECTPRGCFQPPFFLNPLKNSILVGF